MTSIFRALIGLVGVSNILIGFAFLFDPTEMAEAFFIEPLGTQGLATVRADFPAFFLVTGLFALIAAWRTHSAPLKVPALLMGIALLGRAISLIMDGVVSTAFMPMVAEAIMILIFMGGMRAFNEASPHHRT